ncbi:MAG: radical SAM protein [archaeon]
MWRSKRGGKLDDPSVKQAMPRYVDVVSKRKYPKYMIAKSIPAKYNRRADKKELWETHQSLLKEFQNTQEDVTKRPKKRDKSLLDLKILLAHQIMQECGFCERNCRADRLHGEKGYCRAGRNFSVFSAFPHLGEEPELVPSGTIFTGGCSIRCLHCQNWDISQWKSHGRSLTPKMMSLQVKELAEKGCRNINMVGGDPTPFTWQWLETFTYIDERIATIWNSNSYYSNETARLLAGFIDLYLLDFKYGNNKCAEEISDAPRYWEAATRNHLTADKYGELLIRVLVLPEHNECCTRPILQWIHDNLGPKTRVNLMFQYRPEWRAEERTDLSRRLSLSEKLEAKEIAQQIGLQNLVE